MDNRLSHALAGVAGALAWRCWAAFRAPRHHRRPFVLFPRLWRAPSGMGLYVRWGRRLWLRQGLGR